MEQIPIFSMEEGSWSSSGGINAFLEVAGVAVLQEAMESLYDDL